MRVTLDDVLFALAVFAVAMLCAGHILTLAIEKAAYDAVNEINATIEQK